MTNDVPNILSSLILAFELLAWRSKLEEKWEREREKYEKGERINFLSNFYLL